MLTQDGHLTELTVDRFLVDELSGDALSSVQEHLDGCEICRVWIEDIRTFDAQAAERLRPPSVPQAKVLAFPMKRIITNVAVLAAAAALIFIVSRPGEEVPSPGRDIVTIKGSPLSWQVHIHDGKEARLAAPGTIVHPGERFGFKVKTKTDGYLAVLGVDQDGESYVAYPADDSGQAGTWQKSEKPAVLDGAMEFDVKSGHERLVAIFCSQPFKLDALSKKLTPPTGTKERMGLLVKGCSQREMVLVKTPRSGP